MKKCNFYKGGKCINNKDGICQKYKSKYDNLTLHCSGYWSEVKIDHLKYYAAMFSTGMKNKWPNLFYIDLFSGPGRCIIREGLKEIDGTPIEIINLKDKFKKYFLIDKNPICINDLKKRVGKKVNVEYYNDDCNVVLEDIIESIPDNSLSLAIIDPDSLQFHLSSYEQLSKRKVDLIINYPIGPIERGIFSVLRKKAGSNVLDKFHPGWKNIVSRRKWGNSKEANIRNLIKDYINRIEKLGYYSSPLMVPFKNIKNTTMYYLILFSKNKKGIEFWRKKTKAFKDKKPQKSLFVI